MNIDQIKSYVRKSPDILGDIYNIMKYRNLRTEQIYYAKLSYQYDHFDISEQCKEVRNAGALARNYWKSKIERLNEDRRYTHNKALISFNSIMRVGKEYGLKELFNGKTLTNEEINKHERAERREQLTDAMFEMLYVIEESAIEDEEVEIQKGMKEIKNQIKSFNRGYGVTKSLLKDESKEIDGGVEFDLAILFDNDTDNNEML